MKKFWLQIKNSRGQGLVEYALIISIIAIAMIVMLVILGGDVEDIYNSISNEWPTN